MSVQLDLQEVEKLKAEVKRELPGVKIQEELAGGSDEHYWIEFRFRGNTVEVEWRASTGFGVFDEDTDHDDGPDETFVHYSDCALDIIQRLGG